MNNAKLFVSFAILYKYYIFFFWIWMNILIIFELLYPYPNGILFGMLVILFAIHYFFDYFSFYELHEIDLKGSSYMILTIIVIYLIGLIKTFLPFLNFLILFVSNLGCVVIFKIELNRIKNVVQRLNIFFHNKHVFYSKIIASIFILLIVIYSIFVMSYIASFVSISD